MTPEQPGSGLFDKGMQPERTALAWRRTGLALTVASLGATRALPGLLGTWALIPAGFGVALSVWVLGVAHRRHTRAHRTLTSSDTDPAVLHGGALPAIVAALTAVMGCLALVIAILG